MKMFLSLVATTVAVLAAAYIIPGVFVMNVYTAFLVALVLGVLNMFFKPILVVLTLPITLITLGLFSFVINVFLVMVTDYLVTGFELDSWITAVLFSVAVSLVNSFFSASYKS